MQKLARIGEISTEEAGVLFTFTLYHRRHGHQRLGHLPAVAVVTARHSKLLLMACALESYTETHLRPPPRPSPWS